MPSNHLILCRPLLLLPSIFPSIRVFSNELVLCIRWPKYWSFSFSISPSNEYSRLLSFRMDWLDLLAVQGTLKSLKIYGTVNSNCRFSWHQRMSAKNLIIKDQKWQCDLCFLTDTTLHMNEPNLKLRKGKVWGQEEKGAKEDEMVGWHHRLNGHEFVQTPGDSEGQGSLVCCMQSMRLHKVEHDWATEQQHSVILLFHRLFILQIVIKNLLS